MAEYIQPPCYPNSAVVRTIDEAFCPSDADAIRESTTFLPVIKKSDAEENVDAATTDQSCLEADFPVASQLPNGFMRFTHTGAIVTLFENLGHTRFDCPQGLEALFTLKGQGDHPSNPTILTFGGSAADNGFCTKGHDDQSIKCEATAGDLRWREFDLKAELAWGILTGGADARLLIEGLPSYEAHGFIYSPSFVPIAER